MFLVLLVLYANLCSSQVNVYFIPGQGSDARIFRNIHLPEGFVKRHVRYFTPPEGWDMRRYSVELSNQIDKDKPYCIIGLSLGGMLATEMNSYLQPKGTCIVSSAKTRNELPVRYKLQKTVPIYNLFSAKFIKNASLTAQKIVEPDSRFNKPFFDSMLLDKDPLFLRRTISMIMNWKRRHVQSDIYHIHGDNDRTIPIRNVENDKTIIDGSHMMTYTRSKEIEELIINWLLETVNSN